GAGMLVAVPPEPITALGNVKFLPSPLDCGLGIADCGLTGRIHGPQSAVRNSLQEIFAGSVQSIPGRVVFFMANPDSEIMPNPAAREEVGQCVARRMLLKEIANLHGSHPLAANAALVQSAQESHPSTRVMLPAIFAIENDAN